MVITGWVDFLKKRAVSGQFGFHLYRGKRLIEPYAKIGIRDHPSNANIFGHVYLPKQIPVSFTKNKIERSGDYYDELEKFLTKLTDEHRQISNQMQRERMPQINPKVITDVNKNIEIIERALPHSLILKELFPTTKQRQRALKKDADTFGLVDAEKRNRPLNKSSINPIPKNLRVRQPKENRQKKKWWSIEIPTIGKIKIRHEFLPVDEQKMYYQELNETDSQIELIITTNTRFEAWGVTKDQTFYATMNIINALARFIYDQSENKNYTFFELQEDLFRSYGKEFHKRIE